MVSGISNSSGSLNVGREDTDNTVGQKTGEDSRMSISHLLLYGYVIDTVEDGIFSAKFRSLRVDEINDINIEIVHKFGQAEGRVSSDERHKKIIARSIGHLSVSDQSGKKLYDKDFGDLEISLRERELDKLSSLVYNKVFSMYLKFEENVSNLISRTDIKN